MPAALLRVASPPAATVVVAEGYPGEIDRVAALAEGPRRFLRAAWFGAGSAPGRPPGRTIVARRPCGTPFAAIPTAPLGPAALGLRTVPGSYWPFRGVAIADDAGEDELAAMLGDPATCAALAPGWRLGPVHADDPAVALLKRAAGRAGWTVLARPLGHTFLFDLAATHRDGAWPRKSTRRRLAGYERQLAQYGAVGVRHISGVGWTDRVLADLGRIEAASWIARAADGNGKFLTAAQRARWRAVIADPALAEALSATILYAGTAPVAFSFDLRAGDRQYSIASSYDERFAACRPGKIVTYHELARALAAGVATVDLGVGDSGYKREMGAQRGSAVLDLLFVRSRPAATLLSLKWGGESAVARAGFDARPRPTGGAARRLDLWLAAGAVAATMFALSE